LRETGRGEGWLGDAQGRKAMPDEDFTQAGVGGLEDLKKVELYGAEY
jgi:hypothetical protein